MTRPELAVVLSYAKIDVYNALTAQQETLEDFLKTHPMRYFPEVLRRRYLEFIPTHRLSPQILATLISNDIVNRMGPAFVKRVQLDTGADEPRPPLLVGSVHHRLVGGLQRVGQDAHAHASLNVGATVSFFMQCP